MSAEAVIGSVHTFQVLFADENNNAIAVLNPLIEVFTYDALGAKVVVVPSTAMAVDPTEVGRYVYPLTIAATFVDGDTVYGNMTGTNPTSGDLARAEQTVNIVSPDRASGGGGGGTGGDCGLRAQFVKGG